VPKDLQLDLDGLKNNVFLQPVQGFGGNFAEATGGE